MEDKMMGGLVLVMVLLTALFGSLVLLQESPRHTGAIPLYFPKKLPGYTIPTAPPTTKPTTTTTLTTLTTTTTNPTMTSTTITTTTTTTSTTTSSTMPSEPDPFMFSYSMFEQETCKKLMYSLPLPPQTPGFKPYCTGKYDFDTGEWQFLVGFTYVFGQ